MAENNKQTSLEDVKKEALSFTEKLENMKQYAAAIDNMLPLVDLTRDSTKTWTVFNKDTLRTYLQSPYSVNSQNNLRNLSKFLYTLSFPLRRIVNYFASLPSFSDYKVNLDFRVNFLTFVKFLSRLQKTTKITYTYDNSCIELRQLFIEISGS